MKILTDYTEAIVTARGIEHSVSSPRACVELGITDFSRSNIPLPDGRWLVEVSDDDAAWAAANGWEVR